MFELSDGRMDPLRVRTRRRLDSAHLRPGYPECGSAL